MFKVNKTLIHLNLSHCDISRYECLIMKQGLKDNHTLLGLHMIGNEMNTNALGFLHDDTNNLGASHMITGKINDSEIIASSKEKLHFNITSNCWI